MNRKYTTVYQIYRRTYYENVFYEIPFFLRNNSIFD